MDFQSNVVHEVSATFLHSIIFYVILELSNLIGWMEYVLWPILVILIFVTIIDDMDGYPDSVSTPNQGLRLAINFSLCVLATLIMSLVCDVPDVIDDDSEKTLFEISTTCRYGWVGLIVVRYCLSLTTICSTRASMASWILLFNLFYSIWVHEIYTSVFYSSILLIVTEISSLIHAASFFTRVTLLILIFMSIIDDMEAFPETVSISIKAIRFLTNVSTVVFSLLGVGLVCEITDEFDEYDKHSKKTIHGMSAICYYGWFGVISVAYLLSLAIFSAIRSFISLCALIFKIFHSLWLHFNDPMD